LVAQGKSAAAHKGMTHAAKVLATTALDLIAKPELIAAAKQHLEEMKGIHPYVCPLSDEIKPPSYSEEN